VAFVSSATDLVAGLGSGTSGTNVFLYDRLSGASVLVSHTSAGGTTTGNGTAFSPVISADGRYVAFLSDATNLLAGQIDANNGPDVFLYDRVSGTNTLVSHTGSSGVTAGCLPV
jgi:Tol biopolymer transport system component